MKDDPETPVPIAVDDLDTQPVSTRRPILVVDDVPANLLAVEAALEPLRRQVITALSGREALAKLLELDFSLVLLDAHMPDMDGFETAQLIRARPRTRHLPIIFLTAHHHEPSRVLHAYRLGAVDFLVKPIEPDILRAKASVFVTLQDRTEELATERLEREFEARHRTFETAALRREMAREHAARTELARLNQLLADADRRKDQLLAMVAREVGEPIAALRSVVDRIECAADRLDASVVDVLDRETAQLAQFVTTLSRVAHSPEDNAGQLELPLDAPVIEPVTEPADAITGAVIEPLGDPPTRPTASRTAPR
ncbi:MAG TPA: response regulator [Kofleriaceae bacterium]|nr:response regulator [Kofleriaceae bacterium]